MGLQERAAQVKVERLTSAEDFRRAYREGQRIADDLAIIYVRRTGLPVYRVGIAVGKRIGSAVKRNRLRRKAREAYRQLRARPLAGTDLVIVLRTAALEAAFAAIQESLRQLLGRSGLVMAPSEVRTESGI